MISLIAKHKLLLGFSPLVIASLMYAYFESKPRTFTVNEVPIAFWSWRAQAPSTAEVQRVFALTRAKTLFQRAGQFDTVDGKIDRIHPVNGTLPLGVEIHLVYNGTRRLLQELEKIDVREASASIAETFQTDAERAKHDGAQVVGLQLDIDFPTRLLPRYTDLLHGLRYSLPKGTQLSITGLPTWMASIDFKSVLAEVDFWAPQLYGADIPADIAKPKPISSAKEVTTALEQIREIDKPYYAGLAAYGYTGLYGKDGALIELRGDIDPYKIFGNSSLEIIDIHTPGNGSMTRQTRYAYRARKDFVLDGLIINEGETLVVETPSVGLLRDEARLVRQNGGGSLRGICLFRLPTDEDRTTLTSEEIAAAVFDNPVIVKTELTLRKTTNESLTLKATNAGSIRNDSVTVDLDVAPGTFSGLNLESGFSSPETLCKVGPAFPRPCSQRRANLIRLKLMYWKPGDTASATLTTPGKIPDRLSAIVSTPVEDGRTERKSFEITVSDN